MPIALMVLSCEPGLTSDSSFCCEGSSFGILREPTNPFLTLPNPLRMLAVEFSLLKPPLGCALHLLLTLSFRFNIALWTKPPIPLVGDGGLSVLMRFCKAGIERPNAATSASGEVDCTMSPCSGMVELMMVLFRTELNLAGGVAAWLSAWVIVCLSGSLPRSFVKPGNCLLPNELSVSLSSSRLRLYAADPTPRSAVWRKKAGSFVASSCAISGLLGLSLDVGLSGDDAGEVRLALFSWARTESGRLRIPEGGLFCQDMVFAREGIAALGDAFDGLLGLSDSGSCLSGLIARLRSVSSRMASRLGEEGVLVVGVGVPLTGVRAPIERVDCGVFSGDMERSLSATRNKG